MCGQAIPLVTFLQRGFLVQRRSRVYPLRVEQEYWDSDGQDERGDDAPRAQTAIDWALRLSM